MKNEDRRKTRAGRGAQGVTRRHRFEIWLPDLRPPDGCWEWEGSRLKTGYGRIRIKGKDYKAHRLSYMLYIGRIPKNKIVCHSCDNPPCVNPNHLWLGTHADNSADSTRKNRQARGEKISSTVKLTVKIVREMRALWKRKGVAKEPGQHGDGALDYSELGRRFGVSNVQARNIILRKSWKHV